MGNKSSNERNAIQFLTTPNVSLNATETLSVTSLALLEITMLTLNSLKFTCLFSQVLELKAFATMPCDYLNF